MSNISVPEILSTLLILQRKSIGRYQLSEMLGVTRAKTRNILDKLQNDGIIHQRAGRAGSVLSEKGVEIVEKLNRYVALNHEEGIFSIPEDLHIGSDHLSILFNAPIDTIGLDERDIAVRSGATGAITLIYDKHWYIPPNDEPPVKLNVRDSELLNRYRIIIITFGDQRYNLIAASKVVYHHLTEEISEILGYSLW